MSQLRSASAGLSRRTFITGSAGALALTPVLAPAVRAARTLKLGYVSPQTGPLAPFGEADRWVIDQMKAAFKDGIAIGGKKHDVQIILKDSQSNPNRSGEVANDLILKDKVALMLTAGTPETAASSNGRGTRAVAAIAPPCQVAASRSSVSTAPSKVAAASSACTGA